MTRRGKHVGPFSYYHARLVATLPQVAAFLGDLANRLDVSLAHHNVVKLDRRTRVSFLCYADFAAPFPALQRASSCDVDLGTCRRTDYAGRLNPPILHRKELLLPADDPLVPDAERLTSRLLQLGAFAEAKSIGTRQGWQTRLSRLGLAMVGGELVSLSCPRR